MLYKAPFFAFMKYKILIVEDDLRLARLIEKGLAAQNFSTQLAYDGAAAKELLESNDFDLLITDIVMPKTNGIDLVKWLRSQQHNLPIIMLTALGSTNQKLGGFDAGADDYLVKPFEMKELIARIKVLLKRTHGLISQVIPDILTYDELTIELSLKKVTRAGHEIYLTSKEYDLLLFFMKHPEKVLTRDEIASEVWGVNFNTGTNFIDVYISYLRQKIDKPFTHKLIHTKVGMGFVLYSKK